MGREDFLSRLRDQFPEAIALISEYDDGLLTCEVAAFRRSTELAMDQGRFWQAERHFRFVEELPPVAEPLLLNALEVSYLEDLALGEFTAQRHQAIRERMPKALRNVIIGHNERWR